MMAEDAAVRQRRLMKDRVHLQEGVEKARPWILPQVKVTVTEVGKEEKRGKRRGSLDQGISQEPEIINDIQKENPVYLTDQEDILQHILATK